MVKAWMPLRLTREAAEIWVRDQLAAIRIREVRDDLEHRASERAGQRQPPVARQEEPGVPHGMVLRLSSSVKGRAGRMASSQLLPGGEA